MHVYGKISRMQAITVATHYVSPNLMIIDTALFSKSPSYNYQIVNTKCDCHELGVYLYIYASVFICTIFGSIGRNLQYGRKPLQINRL
jgi:hypothetical protein